jgi:hypothetical protein
MGHIITRRQAHKEDRMGRKIAATFAALGLSLLLVSPALATTPLHQETPIDWNDAEFQGDSTECDGVVLEPGQVLWHFILSKSETNDPTMDATFADASFNVDDLSPTMVSPDNDTADHWTVHWDIITTQTTLLSASTSGTGLEFNLSHICAGPPPPEIPEAPASVLLVGSAGLGLLGYFLLRRRRSGALV